MSEYLDELTPESRGMYTVHTAGGSATVLYLGGERTIAIRYQGHGAAMPHDGELRDVRWVTAWPKVGYHMRFRFTDESWRTTTHVTRIARRAPIGAVMKLRDELRQKDES